jgi:uncharacterized repeat protein (TIGR01451 family)
MVRKLFVFLIVVLVSTPVFAQTTTWLCGDANGNNMVNGSDVMFLRNYIFGGTAPNPLASANVDGRCGVNYADVIYLQNWIMWHYPPGALNCQVPQECTIPTDSGNSLYMECPPYSQYPESDSIAIPIYFSNDDSLLGFFLGFHNYSDSIIVTSISTEGSLLAGRIGAVIRGRDILVDFNLSTGSPMPSQVDGLLMTLSATRIGGSSQDKIDIRLVNMPPAGDALYLFTDYGICTPILNNCPGGIERASIRGMIFNDADEDCAFDPAESTLAQWMIVLNPLNHASIVGPLGQYQFLNLDPGSYTVNEVIRPYWDNNCPSSRNYHIDIDSTEEIDNIIFGNNPVPIPVVDLAVNISGTPARSEHTKTYGITYQNKGNAMAHNVIVWLYLSALVEYQSCSNDCFHEPGGSIVFWQVGDLGPGASGQVSCIVHAHAVTGQVIYTSVEIQPTSGDENPANNYDHDSEIATGSLDPNQKLVTPEGYIAVTDTLRYHIDFQNVGNDTAFNVVVVDTLDPSLEIASLELGASLHQSEFSISGRALTWTFNDINLPDSIVNEPASKGFVEFMINPKVDLPQGTIIQNTGVVYFDINPPVVTNMVINTIGPPPCTYVPGDVNGPGTFTGLDITYMVRFFKGGPAPTYSCECTPGNTWYVSGDVNGSCSFTGLDITYSVRYFKGGPAPIPCSDCPPAAR